MKGRLWLPFWIEEEVLFMVLSLQKEDDAISRNQILNDLLKIGAKEMKEQIAATKRLAR